MNRLRMAVSLVGVLLFVVAGCLLDSGEELYGIGGRVRDEAGHPVSGVLVRKSGAESGSTYTRSNGEYWLAVGRAQGEIALVPMKSGWVFCPGRLELVNAGGHHHTQDFTGFYGGRVVIDGFISDHSGIPVEGVRVVNEEPGVMQGLTSVTNYMGYYRFNNVIAGYTYRFVPSKPGCAFSPAERAYELPARDYLQQNYTVSCVESFGLSGRITDLQGAPVAGVAVKITPDGVTAITDVEGYYARYGLAPSAGLEIKPEKDGCIFEPTSREIYAPPGDVSGVDFLAYCGETYRVSGCIRTGEGGFWPGVAVRIEGGCCPGMAVSRADDVGRYEFRGLPGGFDYVLKPEFKGLATTPDSIVIYHLDRDYTGQDFVFSSEQVFFLVSGRVLDRAGTPLAGVTIEFAYIMPLCAKPGQRWAAGPAGVSAAAPGPPAINLSTETDSEGRFSIAVPGGMTVMFQPSSDGCYFIPYARWRSGDIDYESQDFRAHCGGGSTISGYIEDTRGEPVEGIEVGISGEGYSPAPLTYTDSTGYYELSDLPDALELTVRPSVDYSIVYEGCIFCPPNRVYGDLREDHTAQNFTLSCPQP